MANVGERHLSTRCITAYQRWRAKHLATPYDVDDKASADTLVDRLAEVKPETFSDKLADIKAGILHERQWVM